MRNRQSGFTLVELITVMLLIGILSAGAFSRFGDTAVYRQALFIDQLHSYLRLPQQLAMTQKVPLADANHGTTATFSLIKQPQAQWQVIIANGTHSQSYQLNGELDVKIDSQALASNDRLDLSFDANGDISARSFPQGADISFSTALQIGENSLCIAPTGFSYEGPCI